MAVARGATVRSPISKPAIQCINKFIKTYENAKSYSTKLKKTEYVFGSRPITENIEIHSDKTYVQLKFLDRGWSGVRDNGMTITYRSGDYVDIKFGRPHGLGFILNGLANLVIEKHKKLYDPDVIENQIFTINRSGFGYLEQVLKKDFPLLKTGKLGRLTVRSSNCDLTFKSNQNLYESVRVSPTDSIFKIEEEYGTLAYLIFKENLKSFSNFADLFHIKKTQSLRISPAFTDFNLSLGKDNMPSKFEIFWQGKLIGRYEFENTIVH